MFGCIAVDGSEAHRCVERELVVHLPYGTDQTRERLRLGDNAVRIDFENGPDLPFVWPFDDGIKEKFAMLIRRQIRCHIPVNGSPVPALRHNTALGPDLS